MTKYKLYAICDTLEELEHLKGICENETGVSFKVEIIKGDSID